MAHLHPAIKPCEQEAERQACAAERKEGEDTKTPTRQTGWMINHHVTPPMTRQPPATPRLGPQASTTSGDRGSSPPPPLPLTFAEFHHYRRYVITPQAAASIVAKISRYLYARADNGTPGKVPAKGAKNRRMDGLHGLIKRARGCVA